MTTAPSCEARKRLAERQWSRIDAEQHHAARRNDGRVVRTRARRDVNLAALDHHAAILRSLPARFQETGQRGEHNTVAEAGTLKALNTSTL